VVVGQAGHQPLGGQLDGLAAVLPLYCFIGWEGAADLAEETNDPRSVTPWAMIRANYVSVGASLFMIIGFLIALPVGIGKLLGQPKNPLVYIFQSHFGAAAADVLQVVVFLAIFSCVLANMVVATRLAFALSRDKMLPGSGLLGRVNTRTRTPVASIVLVAAVGIGINLLTARARSPGAAGATSRWAAGSCRWRSPRCCTRPG
jgi:amino acid transporter